MNAQPPPNTTPARLETPLWRNVSFTLMWTSTAASGFGDRIIMLAALVLLGGFAVGDETSNARVGINAAINFWFFLPYVLLCIPGGWLADRLPRKWLLLGCDEARALVLLLAFLMLGELVGPTVPESHQPRIFAILFAIGCFAAIFSPTRNAIVPQIIPPRQLQPANAILISIATIASMVGLLLGGLVIDENDGRSVRAAIFLALLFYAVSGTFFAFLKVRDHRDAEAPAAPAAGTPRRRPLASRYILQHRRVLVLIGLTILVWGAAMVVFQATLSLTRLAYDLPPGDQKEYWSILATALGVGMIAGALVVAGIRTRRESDLVMFTAIALAGLCTLLLAITPIYALGLVFAFGVGLFGNVVIITVTSLLQTIAPNYIRGRVMGVTGMLNTISNVLINLVIWQTPDADNAILVATAVMGPLLVLIGAVGLGRSLTRGPQPTAMANAFWRLDRFYTLVWHRLTWRGRHHIPRTGAVLMAANHTTGLDPFLMQAACPRVVHWLMLTSYRFRAFEPLWRAIDPITLDRDSSDVSKLRQVVNSLRDGKVVGMFPEGSLQRTERELKEFQPGIAMVVRRSGAQILPVWIEGTPRKQNMLWHFLYPSHSTVRFGKPYEPDTKKSVEELTDELRQKMLVLAGRSEPPHGA